MHRRVITAKFPGRCRHCGGHISVGQRMLWGGRRMAWHLPDECWSERLIEAFAGDRVLVEMADGTFMSFPAWCEEAREMA